ncbi:hypothetical protein PG988_011356 [Apiospora saccharicola]
MTFHYFCKLPKELQVEIWRYALLAESQERVVLLHDYHVVPRRQLISPLLSTNQTCRDEALRFYTFSLQVVDVPIIAKPSPQCVLPYSLSQKHILMKCELMHRLLNLPNYAPRGTLRLSLTHDTFIKGLDFSPQYFGPYGTEPTTSNDTNHTPNAMGGSGSGVNGKLQFRPITKCLDREACRRIVNLVVAEQGHDGSAQHGTTQNPWSSFMDLPWVKYSRKHADGLWKRSTFSGCRTFQHLWVAPRPDGSGLVLENATGCAWTLARELEETSGGGRGLLNIRSWTAVEERDETSGEVESRVYDVDEAGRSGLPSYRLSKRSSVVMRG